MDAEDLETARLTTQEFLKCFKNSSFFRCKKKMEDTVCVLWMDIHLKNESMVLLKAREKDEGRERNNKEKREKKE